VSNIALTLRNVSKTFGDQRALRDVSFDIAEGEIHALVGENGSGKSTLIKVLSGFHQPDPGSEVLVGDRSLQFSSTEDSRRLGLRFVHQDLGLIEEFSAIENFGLTSGFNTKLLGINWEPLKVIATECLARVGVQFDLNEPVSTLTAVERTALAIARTLDDSELGRPKLLVLDEPTAALPTDDVERLFQIVREVAAQGVAVMYVSHRLDEVTELCTNITALRDGEMVGTGLTSSFDRRSLAELIVGSEVAEDDDRRPAPVGQTPMIIVRGLTTTTLLPFDLDMSAGEIVGIVGLDGSGRETLAKGFYGDANGSAERITVGERSLAELSPRASIAAGIGLVLANREPGAAIRSMSIKENLTLASLGSFVSNGVINDTKEHARAGQLLEELDIRPRDLERDYATLSGGNRQKVIFGKWLSLGPQLLILDDPTSGVDVGARRAMYGEIHRVAAEGTTVLVASSDLEDIVRLCDRVLVLVNGTVSAVLTGADITESKMAEAISPHAR
jgi:ribose transport system ATP-binding protein